MHGRKRRFLPYIVVAVALGVVASFVASSRGVVNQVMDLNNSGVWVTNDSDALWGRANRSAGALDAALQDPNRESGSVNIDVYQDGEAVLAWNMTQFRLFPVDTRNTIAATTTPFGLGMVASVAMGGGVIATISSDKGEVRTTSYEPASIPDVAGLGADRAARATLEVVSGLESGVDVAVDTDGRVFAASASGQWVFIDQGATSYGDVGQSLRSVAVSLVGGVGVITDSTSGEVFTTTGLVQNVGTGAVPQQPGTDTTRIIVSTRSGLSAIALPSGEVTTLYSPPGTPTTVAEPVVMGQVVYGAWGGTPGRVVKVDPNTTQEDTFPKDKDKPTLVKPVFRVNRGSVILNDMATGALFDIDERWSMENWSDVDPDATDQNDDKSPDSEDSPQAKDDHLWVRPGRTSVLHVMDNDDNPGTGIVAITAVTGPDANKVAISPDGQTVVVDTPQTQAEDMSFAYTITNRALSPDDADEESSALVTVSLRAPNENSLPYQPGTQGSDETVPDFTVPSGGTLSIAPAGWWRDDDSDQVSVMTASVEDRVFPVTAQGLIQYRAQVSTGQLTEKLDYTVTDGYGKSMEATLYIRVQSSSELQSIPPVAMSDSVRAVAGAPHVFYPLDNDVPGCDPLDKQAHLALASPVSARVGIEVSTDLLTGAVTITAERVGAYFLDYVASFGSGFSAGKIRVDITSSDQLVAMPDTAVIHGTVPVVVDALSNDRDQLGSILTVTSAQPRDPDRVRVGILQGRWLRIDLVSSVIDAAPTLIDYSVTNGVSTATGQVSVTQTPMPDVDHVSIVDDHATVRVGDVTTIAVLDNDSSQSGEPLVLNDNVEGMANAGQLRVDDPSAPNNGEDVGQAFTDGNKVRYVAPVSGEGKRVRIQYQAGVAVGSPMTGYVWVDVVPEPTPEVTTTDTSPVLTNNVPTPGSVEARVVVGDSVRIPVAIYGQDPDGDSVTVAGLRTPPKFGRVVDVGADSLTYESYPEVENTGMDSFQFYVQDRFGAVGIGTARVGLSPPVQAPPPLSVDDVVTAQPGVEVTVFPMSNDVVAIGTGETSIAVSDTNVVVDQEARTLVTTAPGEDEPAVSISYHLDAGGVAGTSAQIMVRSQVGYLNPPDVFDHAAEIIDGATASVDVLDDAWDVDGPDSDIHIISVGSAGTFDGAVVSVPILDRGQVVPFVVEDGDGAQAMAVVFVPSLTDGRPTLNSDGLIRMDSNGKFTVDLNDYISSPRHQDIHLTLASQVWTAPSSYLDFTVDNDQQITLQARADYVGPAALTVEVRDSPDSTDPGALTGVVTIPVQIGAATPVLWCPEDVQEIVQGGAPRSLDVAELCHAWMPTQTEVDALRYAAAWAQGGDQITLTGKDQGALPSDFVTLQALPDSRPGVDNILTVGVDGYEVTGQLRVRVIPAPKPTMSVSSVTDVQTDTTVEVPVTVTSPMAAGIQNIVSVIPTSGPASTWTFTDTAIQVTPTAAGVSTFDVVGSDIADDSRTDRQVTASFSVTAYGAPDPPSPPQPGTQLRSGSAHISFQPGADNGAPILGYEVKWESGTLSCGLNTTCEIPDLTNGTPYRFQAKATNKAGESDWSEPGPQVIPNAIPGAVTGLTASNPDCGSVLLSWGPTLGEGTAPTMYHLTWDGQTVPATIDGANTTFKPTGLDNNKPYTFTIVAENEAGMSQIPTRVTSQSSCKPQWPSSDVVIKPTDMGDTAQVKVSWPKADPQGPDPVTYSVVRSGPDGTKTFAPTTELNLGDVGDQITLNGQDYTYTVTASNATGGTAHTSAEISGTYTAIGHPDPWASVGGADAVRLNATGESGQIEVGVDSFPKFHDTSGYVDVTVGGRQVTLRPGAASQKVTGFTNGTDLEASFVACNTSSCADTQVISLAGGPFADLTPPILTPGPGEGRQVCFTASGSGNGRPATLVVTGDNGVGEFRSKPSLSPSLDRCTEVAWDTEITFTAYLKTEPTTPSRKDSDSVSGSIRSAIGTPDDWAPGAVTAAPTVVNGVVQSGSVTLNVTSFPASNGGTLAVTYAIVQTGATGTIPASGSTVITGLSNGTAYSFIVTASNGPNQTNKNTPVTVTATPYGLLDPPQITEETPTGTKVCLRVATASTGTNGAPANLVLSSQGVSKWESGLTTSATDSGKQCFDTGDYKTRMTFDAVLVPGMNQARPDSGSTQATFTSTIGTPGDLKDSNILATPTGVTGQVRIELTGDLPPHNGGPDGSFHADVTGLPSGGKQSVRPGEPLFADGFTDGVPTTLSFVSCNQETCGTTKVSTTVTTAGPLSDLKLVRISPDPTDTQPRADKNVCVEYSGKPNGSKAFLSITNTNTGKFLSTPPESSSVITAVLCEDAGGPDIEMTFSVSLNDASGLIPPRASLSDTVTGKSAPDLGPMDVSSTGAPEITYNGTTTKVCASFLFSPNGGDAQGTITVGDVVSGDSWETADVTNFAIPSGTKPTKTLCGTIASASRTLSFTAEIIDKSEFGRDRVTASSSASVEPVPPMDLKFDSSSPPPGTKSNDKEVCATFIADGAGLDATLEVTGDGQTASDTQSGVFPVTACVVASRASQTVVFEAVVRDASNHGRQEKTLTQSVVSAGDFTDLSATLHFAGTRSGSPSTDKWVCIRYTSEGDGLDTKLTVAALGQTAVDEGTGALFAELCVDSRGAYVQVPFTATVTDETNNGRAPWTFSGSTYSAQDFPELTVSLVSSGPAKSSPNYDKHVCASFTANGGGGEAKLTVTTSDPNGSAEGLGTDEIEPVELCVDAGSASKTVIFIATVTDNDGNGRTSTSITESVTSPEDPPDMTLKFAYSYSDKYIYGAFTGNGNGLSSRVEITNNVTSNVETSFGTGEDSYETRQDVLQIGSISSVTFTAVIKDTSDSGRPDVTVTHTWVRTNGPSCTYSILDATSAMVGYQQITAYSSLQFQTNIESHCAMFNGDCLPITSDGGTRVTFPSGTDLYSGVSFWMINGGRTIATCTPE